jgi:hypothetical protein
MYRVAAASLFTVFCAIGVGCAPGLEPDDWTLQPAAGAATLVYPEFDLEARRAGLIDLVEDQIFGNSAAVDSLLGRAPANLAALPDGRIAVLDRSNFRGLLYDAEGTLLRTFGRQGQGPGEFQQPMEIFLAGDGDLRVWDVVGRRLTRWTQDGALVGGSTLPRWGALIAPLPDGDLIWREGRRTPDGQDTLFLRVDASGEPVEQFANIPWPTRTIDPPLGEITNTESDAWWVGVVPPSFAASPEGNVYLSSFAEYQVYAFAPDGAMRWALQVKHARPPLARAEIDLHMALHARRFPTRTEGQVDWPARQYALADLRVDGHGHLYVFPYVPKGTPPTEPRPVDVYSEGGERLFSGMIQGRNFTTTSATYNGPMYEVSWQAAVDDYVYGLAENVAGEREVVRFRLVEPF